MTPMHARNAPLADACTRARPGAAASIVQSVANLTSSDGLIPSAAYQQRGEGQRQQI